ncbi:putative proline iminopeptidase [Microstroma glucosiphilum]|uniref:Proline iminopeptidase n=1 Tax=Pseudomicrostroma glucosiphilum TaxID=1684307 RepID=A0A316U6L1_9BASI|nr:putative proline iminopeptidase [Pseudomicrostroma glucosiphilum]PWN20101.1 putative proline iminopeptidase [Pseudomicrostroma glucosiphilum]
MSSAESNLPSYHPIARSLNAEKETLRQQYPPVQAYKTGTLKLPPTAEKSIEHEIYYELSGKEGGYPVVYLHGGPGGGISEGDRRWFDPQHYQILTFDQRGSGKSTPAAELEGNTTWDLVEDIERLRKEVMKVDKWHVFGGSWGSTLSLAYAQTHPERVSALILRGIFTLRRAELLFFYQEGSSFLWPEQFKPFLDHIPTDERDDMIAAYYKRLTSEDAQTRLEAARRWSTWENATSKLYLDEEHIKKGDDDKWALQFARIESHFFHNRGWMRDGQLLEKESIAKVAHIPTVVVQGRYDVVCPAKTAWDLREVWMQAPGGKDTLEFFLIPDAGHSAKEPGITDKLIYATDKFRSITS